ncbi:MAG: hypothetical protein V8T47_01525 [Oscillospiraceae bacterium]
MEYLTSGRQILSHFFPRISSQRDIQNLWNCCPNQMLWEAISASDANLITQRDMMQLLQKTPFVYAFPEPLPALYLEQNPAIPFLCTKEGRESSLYPVGILDEDGYNAFSVEPLYLICDVIRSQDTFLQSLCKAYPYSSQWDERRLEDGVVVLSVLLTNHIRFRLYCQRIDVATCGEHADSN